MSSPYGKRSGTSANAGKKATTYTAVLPDGRTAIKKSFQVHSDTAFMGCYQLKGEWYFSGIHADANTIRTWGQTPVVATKVVPKSKFTPAQQRILDALRSDSLNRLVASNVISVTRISPMQPEDAGKPWTEIANNWRQVEVCTLLVFHALKTAGLLQLEAVTLGYFVYNLTQEAR